jgi:uncharacterized protein (DUF302 family)
MYTYNFQGRRIAVPANKSFAEVLAAFEGRVPVQDVSVLNGLATSQASRQQIEDAVQKMVGDLGFMVLAKLDPGPLVSLLGNPKKLCIYLLGNPVLANRMFEQDAAVGMYAPLRAVIFEDHDGRTYFTYDVPSSLLGQFDNAEIRGVAAILDDRMKTLAEFLAS